MLARILHLLTFYLSDYQWLTNTSASRFFPFRQCRRGQHPIHHSDKGLQYCAKPYVEMLRRRHARISMTEGYDPRNNGIAERVNGILKEEFLKHMDIRRDNIQPLRDADAPVPLQHHPRPLSRHRRRKLRGITFLGLRELVRTVMRPEPGESRDADPDAPAQGCHFLFSRAIR